MLILKPKVHATIWGGDSLKDIYPQYENIGHLYSCVPYGEFDSEIIYPKSEKSKTLGEFIKNNPIYMNSFPFAVAIVTPQLDLSIQVHPPRGEKGEKNESWIFLNSPTDGKIYGGCKAKNKQEIIDAIEDGSLMSYVEEISIKKGDYTYIQGGTLHAMTSGSIVYEIEEAGGITCRLYDYNRRDKDGSLRPLQIEQGIKYLNVDNRICVKSIKSEKVQKEEKYTVQYLNRGGTYVNCTNIPACITVLGQAKLQDISIDYGTSVIAFPNEKLELGECACVIAQATV